MRLRYRFTLVWMLALGTYLIAADRSVEGAGGGPLLDLAPSPATQRCGTLGEPVEVPPCTTAPLPAPRALGGPPPSPLGSSTSPAPAGALPVAMVRAERGALR